MPFHCATENMAALLRSARLLKFSPSGLLHITGTKRNGPPLGRLYSGALGGSRTGIYSRQISPAAENTSSLYSRVWPYAVGCVPNCTVATIHKDEGGVAVRSKQAEEFDWALNKLDTSVRRTGRITKTLLVRIFHDICRAGYPSGNQALLLLRSCGSLLPEMPLEERTELAHRVWEKLQELGVQYDVSHYNALLKVYLQNEFKFSPTDFLAKMEAAKVSPNRVTYQRLIAAYCNSGDVEGASTVLGFMKDKDLPITEAVFNSLVTGHARAGDIESAKNILTVMKGAGIEPGPETYLALLNAHAERGDLDSLREALDTAESTDCSLMDRDMIQVMATLAKAGHQQHIPELVERLRQDMGYIPVAMNLSLSLITQGLEDSAFLILKTFPTQHSDNPFTDTPKMGNFFLRHCVNMNMSPDKIKRYCKELQESNLHNAPLIFTLSCALEAKKSAMAFELMKTMKEQGLPVRPHYFRPLLIQLVKDNNVDGAVELLKVMKELEVSPSAEMLSIYIFPLFPSVEAAREAFKDAGISVESEAFLSSEIRKVTLKSLAELYTLLSDSSFPPFSLSNFRASLIRAFKESNDVESMVKLTDLFYKDDRFCQRDTKPADVASFLLYNMIESMTEEEVHAHEAKLRKYFNQLKSQNITISVNIYRGMRNLLESYNAPELIKDVIALVHPADREYTGPQPGPRASKGSSVEGLEKTIAKLKKENKPFASFIKQAFQTLSAEENLQGALELKQQYEKEMTARCYSTLIGLCCRHDNVEEALNLKRELGRKYSSAVLTCTKYIGLVKALSKNGRVEEAVDILKEMKEKEVVIDDASVTALFLALNGLAYKGDSHTIKRLQETIFTLGLCKPTNQLCSPMVTSYLESKDLPGALKALMECFNRYGHLPRTHDILVALVEKGDTDLLQKAMDFLSEKRGEMTMLYNLFFAFLQTGRYREARKIIETPGLRARSARLQWFAEKCIATHKMETLEQMVDMTAKLFECDRDEMYCFILRLCKETNDAQKAEAVWMKMQEENVIPRERTLRMLADIMKNNGQEVPFELSEMWYEQPVPKQKVVSEAGDLGARLTSLCKKGKTKEAYELLKDANKKDVVFGPSSYDQVIRALLAKGSIEEAMAVKEIAVSHVPDFKLSEIASSLFIVTQSKNDKIQDGLERLSSMLSLEQVPSLLAITRLIQAMARQGDVEGIKAVESLTKEHGITPNLSSMVFLNNTALAHIKNGDVDSAVEMMETFFTNSENMEFSMAFVFKRVLEDNNDKALDKLSIMAERLANHFACYKPAIDLFLQLLDMGKVEDAKFMLARCNAVAEEKDVLMSYMARKARSPGQVDKIKALLTLIPDFAEKDLQYQYLMKCHCRDKNFPAAKALYEQMQKEKCVIDELSLKRLAVLYRNAGEKAPFPEPPNSFKFYAEKLKAKTATVTA